MFLFAAIKALLVLLCAYLRMLKRKRAHTGADAGTQSEGTHTLEFGLSEMNGLLPKLWKTPTIRLMVTTRERTDVPLAARLVKRAAIDHPILWISKKALDGWFETRLDQAINHPSMEDTMQSLSRRLLDIGREAPDFRLYVAPDHLLSLAELRGRPVVLIFYAADWSPICGDQIALYSELLDEFAEYGAQLLGISVDGPWCHAAFRHDRKLRFPLLSDSEPKGSVARLYGVYQPDLGVAEHALYVIDSKGVIRWSHISPMGINPGADGILEALEELPD